MAGPTDWIAAADALRRASNHLAAQEARAALVAGAEAGAIVARAQRFTVEVPNACGQKMAFEDELVELPREFWSSEGRVMKDQDWEAGAFSSVVNDNFRHEAFGVEFDRAAVDALLQRSS